MFETFTQYLITHGVPEYTIAILLFLPIVASLVTLTRYLLGWKSLTIYTSVLLTFALYDLARGSNGSIDVVQGLIQGGFIVISSTFVAYALQALTREIRMHYLARVSIIVSTITIIIFGILFAAVQLNNDSFVRFNPISLIIVVLVIDIFIRSYIRRGWRKAIQYVFGTILLSYGIFVIIAQDGVREFVLRHPETTLVLIVFNGLLGRWRGLRLSEYLRFNNLLNREPYDPEDIQE